MIASPGLAVLIGRIAVLRCALLAPPPTLTVSEWADAHRMVPSYSAEAGQWVTARTPYLREPMDSFSEIGVNRVVFKKCARIGATEAGLNIVGYFIDQDPSAIMIVQPTADDAKDFSKEQLGPTITETPVLHAKVSDAVKDAKNTITKKVFPGGSVKLGGANSPRFFRRITARVIVLEEVNGYGKSKTAKGEGDQIKLAEKRAETHGYRAKVYINSTPTTKGECRISQEFAKSDQRYYHVPCPHCGHAQRLVWERLRYKDLPAPQYQCAGCDQLIDESDKDAMVAHGTWVATVPQHTTRGYHLNALYSPFVRWSKLVEEWIDAQGDSEALQVFTNTALGEEWEDREAEDIQSALKMRALRYDGRTGDEPFAFHVPRGACLLACGVDKQPGELHYVVRAIGPNEQSWLIEWGILRGDTSRPEVWAQLDDLRLNRRWKHENGADMAIRCMGVDSGDDPDPVYVWTRSRLADYVFALKGGSDPSAEMLPKKWTKTRQKSRLYVCNTGTVKKRILRRIAMAAPVPYALDAGPNFFHVNDRANAEYLAEIFSQRMEKYESRGRSYWLLVKRGGARDEKLDCEVYAYLAYLLGPVPGAGMQAEWERVMADGEKAKAAPVAEPEPKPAPQAASSSWLPPRRGGWLR